MTFQDSSPPVSAASPSLPWPAPLEISSSPRAEPSSRSRALGPSCHTPPAGTQRWKQGSGKSQADTDCRLWRITSVVRIPSVSPPVCHLVQIWVLFSPSELGRFSTHYPASQSAPELPLSAPVVLSANRAKCQFCGVPCLPEHHRKK